MVRKVESIEALDSERRSLGVSLRLLSAEYEEYMEKIQSLNSAIRSVKLQINAVESQLSKIERKIEDLED